MGKKLEMQKAEAKKREFLKEMKEQISKSSTDLYDDDKRRHEKHQLQCLVEIREQEEILEKIEKEKAARKEK